MALINVDLELLQRCLQHKPGSWNDFVDRFLGVIYHVIHYTAYLRSHPLRPEDVEDIASEILLQIVANDYAVLRQFRANSSLATYLTVIARRICVQQLSRRTSQLKSDSARIPDRESDPSPARRTGLEELEEVQKMLRKLPAKEREIVRLFYLEGRSYEEISIELKVPVNSIGPVLNRAKQRLRAESDGSPPPPPKSPTPKPSNSSGKIPRKPDRPVDGKN
ncbi:RNA polymerase sigma factor [Tuwongella immobilis]|uniref:RNA polymerase sigma factor 70 region 4 type 2 domain-containing protein n=1 Tax=Tuwongella immobilis TaxID=692036 RepID=A0A6C2YKF8_9BACT|nr:RNA polymerase sigma factor [Tuwongella immobilis]VIP01595.1 rna polymerase sigma-e factor-like protein : RNA polymerase sigma factor, sigma-70 family OS=Singulisphaera acidiphila (strain ATCC BAA-1392 / DSM 18658 / VKM B-2454 / MOB10) GN=Sinac_1390 PE=4 SV=1: Sigma70_r4_2 [Tuwongella immobilis]VTR98874.1 rna polymerase sigma-e factor-like protein : RNA polymerase sigma factor, sigma-70 family OS=Singulisphaera acidiphila (strain ATCC BAA-1392 / DSM 18658 / VKM B-2454 / MOB10) GN=Sinac_1390 PE